MAELTIKQKAKRYDEVIKGLRDFYRDYDTVSRLIDVKEELVNLVPELVESEDERIRKKIIATIYLYHGEPLEDEAKEMIAYLEKQGEQKSQGKTALEAINEEKVDNSNKVEPKDYNSIDPLFGKPVDKIEPKFHEGDWIIHRGTENIYQVVAVIDNQYQLKYGDNYTIQKCADVDRCVRLWDITKDAKDGDVLYMDNGLSTCTFIYKSINNGIVQKYASYNKFGFEGTTYLVLNDGYICPATKEQRDALFAKMKEASYEWDADKKELKKIKQNLTVTDEELAKAKKDAYNDALDKNEYHSGEPTFDDGWSAAIWYLKKRNALPQNTWKPSATDIKALEDVIDLHVNPINYHATLHSILEQLKKLREE